MDNPRAEEAKNKIYRIPPPGNGNQKQANITDFLVEYDRKMMSTWTTQHNSTHKTHNHHNLKTVQMVQSS